MLVLRYVDGLPDSEVARLLGCSERKVRSLGRGGGRRQARTGDLSLTLDWVNWQRGRW